jgi:DivIVA domain-containing protein
VALERQSIEKQDFPVARRGYDPEAVDRHLSSLADEIEELNRSRRERSESLASTASDQVRMIVEAAETSAAQIQRQAEGEAAEIRGEANTEAQSAREEAADQARDYVGRVSEATAAMMKRIDAMEGELSALVESLRTGSNRLNADLQLLVGSLTELTGSAGTSGLSAGQATAPVAAEADGEPLDAEAESEYAETLTEEEAESDGIAALAAEAEGGSQNDAEGARLIALNMALNGTPREETERYLDANFQLDDRDALLDEVYASVEG